MDTEFITF